MRSVIAAPQEPQTARPVRRIGPVTTRGATTRESRLFSCSPTASNSAGAMIPGTSTTICSAIGFWRSVFDERLLNVHLPTYTGLVRIVWTAPLPNSPPLRVR